jgi:poly(A) polymerase
MATESSSLLDDVDLTTDATPDQILSIVGTILTDVNLAGLSFGTIVGTFEGLRLEITTHRAEVYVRDSRKPEVRFSRSIEEDLARRDFTINAMALELTPETNPTLIDPYGGLADLMAARLRTPLSPDISFNEDPLRILRAARFSAKLHLNLDDNLLNAARSLAHRLAIVSRERVRDELNKLLVLQDPSKGLWFLVDSTAMEHFLPEIPALALEQDPIHRHKDVLAHTIAVVSKCSPLLRLRLAALLHDIGKPATRKIGPEGVSFHSHDIVGAKMAAARLRELRYPNDMVEDVSRLVYLHLRFHSYYQGWTDAAIRRYVRDAGHLLDDLNELTLCDITSRNKARVAELQQRMQDFKVRLADLKKRDQLAATRPPLNGDEVMEILGIPPGPLVGKVLQHLLDEQLERGSLSKDEATQIVKANFQSKSNNSSAGLGRPSR